MAGIGSLGGSLMSWINIGSRISGVISEIASIASLFTAVQGQLNTITSFASQIRNIQRQVTRYAAIASQIQHLQNQLSVDGITGALKNRLQAKLATQIGRLGANINIGAYGDVSVAASAAMNIVGGNLRSQLVTQISSSNVDLNINLNQFNDVKDLSLALTSRIASARSNIRGQLQTGVTNVIQTNSIGSGAFYNFSTSADILAKNPFGLIHTRL